MLYAFFVFLRKNDVKTRCCFQVKKLLFIIKTPSTTRATRITMKGDDSLKDKELLRLLKKNGWQVKRIQSSHHILQKGNQTEVIPVHGKEVPTGLLAVILKRTELK